MEEGTETLLLCKGGCVVKEEERALALSFAAKSCIVPSSYCNEEIEALSSLSKPSRSKKALIC